MGVEYMIPCRSVTPEALDNMLRQAPSFSRFDQEFGRYEFRAQENADVARIPDAHASIEANGIYFCDNGDDEVVRAVLTYLEQAITNTGEPFSLQEL